MARIIDAFTQFLDDSVDPLVNGFLKFTESGTSNTDKDTFADVGETIKNTNPVQLDGAGRCPNVFGTGTYNVISFKDSIVTPGTPGEQIQQFDPVGGDLSGTQFADWSASSIYSIGDKVSGPDGIDYRSITNNNQNNTPASSSTQWEEIQLGRVWNTNVTYSLSDSAYGSDGLLYASRTNSNIGNDPTTDTANWKFGGVNPDFVVKFATATGTVDIITAAFTPAFTALTDVKLIRVKASGANITTTPTIAVDGLVAKTIVKNGNQPLVAGDIFGADYEMLLARNSANDNYELLNPIASKALTTDNLLHLQHSEATGVNGGTATSGSWQTPTMNTVKTNSITGASLSSNQFTLPAGTYFIEGHSQAWAVETHQARIRNITDSTNDAFGTSAISDSTAGERDTSISHITSGEIVITAPKTFELQHQVQTTKTTNGFGLTVGFTTAENIYRELKIWKVA